MEVSCEDLAVGIHYEPRCSYDIAFNATEYTGLRLGMHDNLGWRVVNVLEVRGGYEEIGELRDEVLVEEITGFRVRNWMGRRWEYCFWRINSGRLW